MSIDVSAINRAQFGDIVSWLVAGCKLYLNNFGILFISAALAGVLGVFSLGVLAGPLFAGLYGIILAILDNKETPKVSDIFGKMDRFADTFLFVFGTIIVMYFTGLILGIIPLIGGLLRMAVELAAVAITAFGLLLIIDQQCKASEAIAKGLEIFKANPLLMIGLVFAASLASSIGALAFGIGVLLTLPIFPATMAYVYRTVLTGSDVTVETGDVDRKVVGY